MAGGVEVVQFEEGVCVEGVYVVLLCMCVSRMLPRESIGGLITGHVLRCPVGVCSDGDLFARVVTVGESKGYES